MIEQPVEAVKRPVVDPPRMRPSLATVPHRLSPQGINLRIRIFADNHEEDSNTLAPIDYVPDLTQFDVGLGVFGGNRNDKIRPSKWAGIGVRYGRTSMRGGASLSFYEDKPELDSIGWNDRVSGIWFPLEAD
jgi:hypothetical protein